MDVAIRVLHGEREKVEATKERDYFHGRPPEAARYLCPLCFQPVTPRLRGKKNEPHFSHVKGSNEIARGCDLFTESSTARDYSRKVPLPIYIRRSRDRRNEFLVYVELRAPSSDDVNLLSESGAVAVMGGRPYPLDRQRFSNGKAQIPLFDLELPLSSYIKFMGLPESIRRYWGGVEDTKDALLFFFNEGEGGGRRLRFGESVVVGHEYLLCVPEKRAWEVRHSFDGSRVIGRLECKPETLRVHLCRINRCSSRRQRAEDFLGNLGYGVVDEPVNPYCVWPPTAQSRGEHEMIYDKNRVLFVMPSYEDTQMAIWSPQQGDKSATPKEAQHIGNGKVSACEIALPCDINYVGVGCSPFTYSTIVLPDNDGNRQFAEAPSMTWEKEMERRGEYKISISANYPFESLAYTRAGGEQRAALAEDGSWRLLLTIKDAGRIRLIAIEPTFSCEFGLGVIKNEALVLDDGPIGSNTRYKSKAAELARARLGLNVREKGMTPGKVIAERRLRG